MKTIAIIPARYASTRFPGKPLALLWGKPIIQHVYERAAEAVEDVVVATDDERILQTVSAFGGRAVMTSADHRSGTDRIAEAARIVGTEADIVVNLQGDEPFIRPQQISALVECFRSPDVQIATLATRFRTLEALENPNSPKIAVGDHGRALYFSRSVIPYVRGRERADWLASYPYLKHIGIYAFRRETLQQVTRLPQSPLELAESLEQLRWLAAGYQIAVAETEQETIGIDTPEDLEKAEKFGR